MNTIGPERIVCCWSGFVGESSLHEEHERRQVATIIVNTGRDNQTAFIFISISIEDMNNSDSRKH
jgi:hypothetical protein